MSNPERQIIALEESHFGLDGGAMFGIIPRPLWARTNPPDENNRIAMSARCLLIRDPDRVTLIDTGMGTRWSEKERGIYKIDAQDAGLRQALAAQNLTPEDVDDVILTHLHFDHAGGLRTPDAEGVLRPTFPNARHWVQRRNWSWAHSPSARDAGSYRVEDFDLFDAPDAPPLHLVDGISELFDGIEVLPVHGHTFGMQVVKFNAAGQTYAFVADLIPTASHLRDPYVMGYDLQPLKTVEEKREILYHAQREGWILIFEHDPTTAMARVDLDRHGQPVAVPLE
ncbi:MBL fold metallo-hydrolase [Lujinxingia litoralis]|nr:MBL fold metallo-hydrolase [Lujinxingia litoralis]